MSLSQRLLAFAEVWGNLSSLQQQPMVEIAAEVERLELRCRRIDLQRARDGHEIAAAMEALKARVLPPHGAPELLEPFPAYFRTGSGTGMGKTVSGD